MFKIGDYVICSNKGVCVVENITTLNISGVDKEREYYILKLIEAIPQIPNLVITNDKLTEQTYKECIKANDCEELVKILKTTSQRKQKRLEEGRKETALDAKYSHMAEDNLYGELAVALEINRQDVESYIMEAIGGGAVLS